MISPKYKKLFDGIFTTLETGLSKLGDTAGKQTKAVSNLIHLIKDIPMNSKQDYDVLGFIYEYLISMFAATAGKKAGEFYTPHEVSLLMSEIIAEYLKDKDSINIYDPTSGSGSLLINIGKSVLKYMNNKNNIKYYAQELKQNTYNLTRMNLIMRGISPYNIFTRNADTLEEDWPYFDENDPTQTYEPLYIDAVVSNPPYSQKWDNENKESDPRYAKFGLAPKTKADYAFLLHDLYHLKPDGIMTIILPHGVLFRGGEEGTIRKNLIESNHIDTIIGLPSNIFFGTGIPTIIMILKQNRIQDDILIIDASKGFEKVGKNNKLRASDIKKIVDTVVNRQEIDKYSRVVSQQEIRDNNYNLNIPRYVNSAEDDESFDIYSTLFGGIPKSEINELNEYWENFPTLKNDLFDNLEEEYTDLKTNNLKETILENSDVKEFKNKFKTSFETFNTFLKKELLDKCETLNIQKEQTIIGDDIFARFEDFILIDKYEAYQILDDNWQIIERDLEIIQTEGFEATKKVDASMVIKKKDKKEQEIQEGWVGHIIPFELVQETYLKNELKSLKDKEDKLLEIGAKYEEIIDLFTEEEKESNILNDKKDGFLRKEVENELKDIYSDIETEEILILKKYLKIIENKPKKEEKLKFIKDNKKVNWDKIKSNKDGTFGKTNIEKYIKEIREEFEFEDDSFESKIVLVNSLIKKEDKLKKEVKKENTALHLKTKETIENLSNEQVFELLELKWIKPLENELNELPNEVINKLVNKLQKLAKKYETNLQSIEKEIKETSEELSFIIDELEANKADTQGLKALKNLLGVDDDE